MDAKQKLIEVWKNERSHRVARIYSQVVYDGIVMLTMVVETLSGSETTEYTADFLPDLHQQLTIQGFAQAAV